MVRGKQQGRGIYKYKLEDMTYIGQYNNDKTHGTGEMFKKGKSIYKGRWVNGRTIDKGSSFEIFHDAYFRPVLHRLN
jgi:hypothetical protein